MIEDDASGRVWMHLCANPLIRVNTQSFRASTQLYMKRDACLFHMLVHGSAGYSDGNDVMRLPRPCVTCFRTWVKGSVKVQSQYTDSSVHVVLSSCINQFCQTKVEPFQ